jgi:putative ABC transport system permease protein
MEFLRENLITSVRSILRNKFFALLNILGLTIGITSFIIISLYVWDEITYEQWHANKDTIYRLEVEYFLPNDGGSQYMAVTAPIISEIVQKDYPEVEYRVRIQEWRDELIENYAGEKYYESLYFADSAFFQMFSFELNARVNEMPLSEPYSAVITEDLARKYFGRTDVLGELLRLKSFDKDVRITGILKSYQSNTHLRPEFLVSMATLKSENELPQHWWTFNTYSYLKLITNSDANALASKIKNISGRYIREQEVSSGYHQEYSLKNIKDIHLNSHIRGEISSNNKASFVFLFGAIGIFIIVIACINFMNLATAQSVGKAKEVGVRKILGARRLQLAFRFVSESFILTAISFMISLLLVFLLLPGINTFTNKTLTLNLYSINIIILLLTIFLLVVILAGSYPSFILSSFKPIETLKSKISPKGSGKRVRTFLVIFQFALSAFLVVGTMVVYKQLNFMRKQELGFTKERIIVLPTRFQASNSQGFKLLKDELLNDSEVVSTCLSDRIPGKQLNNNVVRLGWSDDAEWSDMRYLTTDEEFRELYNLKLVAGRWFSQEFPGDREKSFLLNESGVRQLGFSSPEDALGKKLDWQDRQGEVIGVVKDFHFVSLNQEMFPFIIVMNRSNPGYLSIKLRTDNYSSIIERIRTKYEELIPQGVFEYYFLDEDFDIQYKADERFMYLFTIFSAIAIIIACLGLYGLSAFTAESKTKEIGIRKALGATVFQIFILLTGRFSRLILISLVVALPFGAWAMNNWLKNYPFRTEFSPWLFILAVVGLLIIAVITVDFHSIKAARLNPANTFREE